MNQFPAWNYWRYDEDGNFRYDLDYKLFEDDDLRGPNYTLESEFWCSQYFWDAEQAALISFDRDPRKVIFDQSSFPFDEDSCICDNDDSKADDQLRGHIESLADLIKKAQSENVLPPFFPPRMYLAWADRMGVDYPRYISDELNARERELAKQSDDSSPLESATPPEKAIQSKHKNNGPSRRLDNNLTKIILALLIEAKLTGRDLSTLAKALSDHLADEAHRHGDNTLTVEYKTIAVRLEEALELRK